MTANDDLNLNLKMNARILALDSRLAAALRRKVKPSPAATAIALVGLSARLKFRQLALREHLARQENFQRFADRLNTLRLERGLTFEQLGARAALSGSQVHRALHGDLETPLKDLVAICLALRVRAQIVVSPVAGGEQTVIPIGHTLPKDKS